MSHYRQLEIIADTEGVVDVTDSALEAHSFTLAPMDFERGLPKVSATDIAGTAIEVRLWEKVNGIWGQVFDAGAEIVISATVPQKSIVSYGTYAVSKSPATTGVSVVVTRVR